MHKYKQTGAEEKQQKPTLLILIVQTVIPSKRQYVTSSLHYSKLQLVRRQRKQ